MSDPTQPLPEPVNSVPAPAVRYEKALRALTIWMLLLGVAVLVLSVVAGCQSEPTYYEDGSSGDAITTQNLATTLAVAPWSAPFFCLAVVGQMIRLAVMSVNEKVAETSRARASAGN